MNRIKELRKEKGWNQTVLAKKLHTTQANISGWEKEKWQPDVDSLKEMSDIFNVSIDYILGNSSNQLSVMKQDINPDEAKEIWLSTLKPLQHSLIELILKLNELQQNKVQAYMYGLLN